MMPTSHEVTELLLAWSEGDQGALDRLVPLVYAELHRLAKSYMRKEQAEQTLQTTALIHEAYLRLIDVSQVQWQNRAHFFGVAAHLMRQILVKAARERGAQKRGGDAQQVSLDEALLVSQGEDEDLVAIDEAVSALAEFDARKAQVVELKYFGGLEYDEIASHLNISVVTVQRDWTFSKAWLYSELQSSRA